MESALDRTARALDLVPYLLEHQGISIPELAEVFGVSEKQINDDLVLIHMCGLPGYTPLELIEMFYEDGYVTVSDPQSFKKPRRMNKVEMTSVLVSLDLLKSLRTGQIAEEIEVLQSKLLHNTSFENPYVVIQGSSNTEIVSFMENAITKATPVRISYLSATKDQSSSRIILPIEIYVANGSTYLNAWCQTSNGDRTFRLDRIVSFEMIEGGSIDIANQTTIQLNERSVVELLVAKSARTFIEDNRAIIDKIEEGDPQRIQLNPIDREWLIRSILGYGGLLVVTQPIELADEIRARAQAIMAAYGG